jgi:hypothetical protein
MLTLAVPPAFTVIVIAFDVAGDPVTQAELLVITHVIASLCASVEDVYVELVAPEIFVAFFFHWYVGALPPFVAVAVNVTLVPLQIAPVGFVAMLTPAVPEVLIVAVTGVLALVHDGS